MGQLIQLSERRADRSRPSRGASAFFFAIGCPISYLAAERVERALGQIDWVPTAGVVDDVPSESDRLGALTALLAVAEREAEALRLPMIAPETGSLATLGASRAAVHAAEHGAGAAFALAASRLIFCGGYDPADPRLIADAARAAGLSPDAALAAAADDRHDLVLAATGRGLRSRGVLATPAIRIADRWFTGIDAVPGASSFTARRALYGTPAG